MSSLQELANWVQPDRTVLVLGAGASVPSGAPSAAELRDRLIDALDPSLGYDYNLEDAAEILEISVGRRRLIDEVRAQFSALEPTGGMLALGAFPWRSIFTTNYDRLVESAHSRAARRTVAVRSPFDLPNLDTPSATPLFKMHGCTSQDRAFGEPSSIVITGSDWREARNWRGRCLHRLASELEQHRALVIGQSLADPGIRDLLEDIAALQMQIGRPDK